MPECDKSKENKKHVYSQAQAGFFGAVAAGKSTKETTMTAAQARHHLRGENIKNLPKKVGALKRRAKMRRRKR